MKEEYSKTLISFFQTELDIYRSEVVNNKALVYVGQNIVKSLDCAGGDLTFDCSAIDIFDQNNNIVHYSDLVAVCKKYWDDFENKK